MAAACNPEFYRIVAICVIADWTSSIAVLILWWCAPENLCAKGYAHWYNERKMAPLRAKAEARRAALVADE